MTLFNTLLINTIGKRKWKVSNKTKFIGYRIRVYFGEEERKDKRKGRLMFQLKEGKNTILVSTRLYEAS